MGELAQLPEYQALLAAICAVPGDDLPRLVLADWLDEHSAADRAEFIRVQCELAVPAVCQSPSAGASRGGVRLACHESRPRGKRGCLPWCPPCERYDDLRRRERELWGEYYPERPPEMSAVIRGSLPPLQPRWMVFPGSWSEPRHYTPDPPLAVVRRGFVDEVRLPLATFVGGPEGFCNGRDGLQCDGGRTVRSYGRYGNPVHGRRCDVCSGTGRTPGVAAELFRSQPVTTVVLTDREPSEIGSGWSWSRWVGLDDTDTLPGELFDYLPDEDAAPSMEGNRLTYPTRDAAVAALSAACVRRGRDLAGLPPLVPACAGPAAG